MAQFEDLALIAIGAIASDEVLSQSLVLKGGAAIQLIHRVGSRRSQDIDFSVAREHLELEQLLEAALTEHFLREGYESLSFEFCRRGEKKGNGDELGYLVELRVLRTDSWEKWLQGLKPEKKRPLEDPVALRSAKSRLSSKVKIEISRCEFVDGRIYSELKDGVHVQVYTPGMIVAEKLRALCQQMPCPPGHENSWRSHPTERARDFYDIHSLVMGPTAVDMGSKAVLDWVREMFAAKQVPMSMLGNLGNTRDFHATGWQSVTETISVKTPDFDYYFGFVVEECRKLESLWKVNAPV